MGAWVKFTCQMGKQAISSKWTYKGKHQQKFPYFSHDLFECSNQIWSSNYWWFNWIQCYNDVISNGQTNLMVYLKTKMVSARKCHIYCQAKHVFVVSVVKFIMYDLWWKGATSNQKSSNAKNRAVFQWNVHFSDSFCFRFVSTTFFLLYTF